MLADLNKFVASLRDFNCDTVPVKVLRRANEIVNAPTFSEEEVRRKSAAAGEIAAWAIATVKAANLSKEA